MNGAALLSGIALSMMAGFIGLGYLAERLNQKGIHILTTAISGMAIFMVIQGFIVLEIITLAPILWLLFGFFGTSGILSYAGLCRQFSAQLSGRVTTAINLLVFLTAFAASGPWVPSLTCGKQAYREAMPLLATRQPSASCWPYRCWDFYGFSLPR